MPKVRTDGLGGGKGSGRGNLNLLVRQKKAKKSCPLCIESNNGRGCWGPNACRNGPYNPRLGARGTCDCHAVLKATHPRLKATLRAKSFSQWQPPLPAL